MIIQAVGGYVMANDHNVERRVYPEKPFKWEIMPDFPGDVG